MKKLQLTYFLLVLLMSSCMSPRVIVEPGKYTNFNLKDYSTYSFMEVEVKTPGNAFFQQSVDYLKEDISKAMKVRGLTLDDANPDLKINLGVVVEEKEQTRETNLATDPFMYSGQRNYTWKSEEIVVNKYKEGTLTMHLVDAKSNEAVWVGVTSKTVPKKQEKKEVAISEAISDIFAELDKSN